jgi:hypothetical protein
MHEQHTYTYQTIGVPHNKSWSLSKITLRAQQDEFTIKNQKRSFGIIWHCKNSKQSKNIFVPITLMYLMLNLCMTTSVVFIMLQTKWSTTGGPNHF